jgi:hypothetical protein
MAYDKKIGSRPARKKLKRGLFFSTGAARSILTACGESRDLKKTILSRSSHPPTCFGLLSDATNDH